METKQLARFTKELRIHRIIILLVSVFSLFLASVILLDTSSGSPDSIEVTELTIANDSGTILARMGSRSTGGYLCLYNV